MTSPSPGVALEHITVNYSPRKDHFPGHLVLTRLAMFVIPLSKTLLISHGVKACRLAICRREWRKYTMGA